MWNLRYALKRAFFFSWPELKMFLASVIISGFILSFRKWGTVEFNFNEGLANFLLFSLLFMLIFAVFISSQKFLASWMGYECKFKLWEYGPFIGLLLTFMSYGFVPFLYLGNIELNVIEHMRLGKFRQHINMRDLMLVGIAGPFALVFLNLFILVPLFFATGLEFFKTAITVSALIIFFSSLPLPNTNGINALLYSRIIWLIYFMFGLVLIVLMILNVYTYIVALLLAVALAFLLRKIIKDNII